MVGAQIEFGRRADHAVGGVAVGLARGDREVAGQHRPRQRHHDEISDGEVGCTADDVTRLSFSDVHFDGTNRLLELGELLDLGNAADRQRAADRDRPG